MSDNKLISQESKATIDGLFNEAKNYNSLAQKKKQTAESKAVDAYVAAMDKCVSESSTATTNAKTYSDNASTAKTNATNASTSTAAIPYGDTAATAATNAATQKTNAVTAYNNATTISNKKVNGTSMSSTVSSKLNTVTTNKNNASTYATNADTNAKNAYVAAMDKCVSESSTAATNANTYMNTAKTANTNAQSCTTSASAKTYYDTANTAATNAETQKTNAVTAYNNATTISNKKVNGTSMSSAVSSKLNTVTTNKNNASTYATNARTYSTNAYNKYTALKKAEDQINALLAKSSLTESEFLQIVNAGKQASMTTGVIITLPNSLGTTNQWEVADVNHDDTTGTVDLVSKNLIQDSAYTICGGPIGGTNVNPTYQDSTIRNWLTNTYITGFSTNIKNALKTMDVRIQDMDYDMSTLQDKIKMVSVQEIGLDDDCTDEDIDVWKDEGTIYPIFTYGTSTEANNKRIRNKKDGTAGAYFTRSGFHSTSSSGVSYGVLSDGSYARSAWHTETRYGILLAIRF